MQNNLSPQQSEYQQQRNRVKREYNHELDNNTVPSKHHKPISYSIHDPMKIINPFLTLRERTIILCINHEWRNAMLQPCCWKTFTGNNNAELEHNAIIFKNDLFIQKMIPIWIESANLYYNNNNAGINAVAKSEYKHLYLHKQGYLINIFKDIIISKDKQKLLASIGEITLIVDNSDGYDLFINQVYNILKYNMLNIRVYNFYFGHWIYTGDLTNKLRLHLILNDKHVSTNLIRFVGNQSDFINLIPHQIPYVEIIDTTDNIQLTKHYKQMYLYNTLYGISKYLSSSNIEHLQIQLCDSKIVPGCFFESNLKNTTLTVTTFKITTIDALYNIKQLVKLLIKHCINLKIINFDLKQYIDDDKQDLLNELDNVHKEYNNVTFNIL